MADANPILAAIAAELEAAGDAYVRPAGAVPTADDVSKFLEAAGFDPDEVLDWAITDGVLNVRLAPAPELVTITIAADDDPEFCPVCLGTPDENCPDCGHLA